MSSNSKLDAGPPSGGGIPAITGEIDHSRAIHIFPESLKPVRSTILAYSASIVSTTVGFPLDTVKTRMQTHKHFSSYFDCVRKTYLNEGVRGFFRGIYAPLLSTSASKSLSVLIFTAVKPHTYNFIYSGSTSSYLRDHPLVCNAPVCFFTGAIAGGGVSLFACPFEFTKVYAQVAKLVQRKSLKEIPQESLDIEKYMKQKFTTAEAIKHIVKYKGLAGLYSGYKYHLIRDSLSSGVYYSIYESVKWTVNSLIPSDTVGVSPVSIGIAGGVSGIIAWICIFPVDTTKSLIQNDIVTEILRKESGLAPLPKKNRTLVRYGRKLYRGLGISVSRSFLVNMIFFGAYEFSMAHFA